MDNFFAIMNLIVSSAIVVGVAINWYRFGELSCLERAGYSAMAMFCAAIVIKSGYNLSIQEFRSDIYGILFRAAYLIYLIGNTYRNYKKPYDVWQRIDFTEREAVRV